MKNKLLFITTLVLFAALIPACVLAQEDKLLSTQLGVKAGLNLSNLYTNDDTNTEMITGYNVGLFAKLPITRFLAIQPELYFTTKGGQVSYNSLFVDGTAKFESSYIEIPVLVVFNLTDNFNLYAGPYISYLLNGSVTNKSNVTIFDFEEELDTEDFNRVDLGISFGGAFDIGALGLGARYSYGLTKVGKERSFLGTKYTFPDAENAVFNMYVSLRLND